MLNKEEFLKNKKCYLLDGAMGTYLIDSGFELDTPSWSAQLLLDNPQIISKIHQEYVRADADIITTNTFRTNPTYFEISSINIANEELVKVAVELAKSSVPNDFLKTVYIAGSNAPAEDCYNKTRTLSEKDLFDNHSKHIKYLIKAGVDFILNETFGDMNEIEIVCKICHDYKFPFAISVLIKDENTTFFNQDLNTTFDTISNFNPLFVSINCARPEIILRAVPKLKNFERWGVYPNLGSKQSFNSGKLMRDFDHLHLTDFVKTLLREKIFVIGTCCGSNPLDTKLIRDIIDKSVYD